MPGAGAGTGGIVPPRVAPGKPEVVPARYGAPVAAPLPAEPHRAERTTTNRLAKVSPAAWSR